MISVKNSEADLTIEFFQYQLRSNIHFITIIIKIILFYNYCNICTYKSKIPYHTLKSLYRLTRERLYALILEGKITEFEFSIVLDSHLSPL